MGEANGSFQVVVHDAEGAPDERWMRWCSAFNEETEWRRIVGQPQFAQARPGKRSRRCGQCAGCLTQDCGVCSACRDKPKFGGPGTAKQACVKRRCARPTLPAEQAMLPEVAAHLPGGGGGGGGGGRRARARGLKAPPAGGAWAGGGARVRSYLELAPRRYAFGPPLHPDEELHGAPPDVTAAYFDPAPVDGYFYYPDLEEEHDVAAWHDAIEVQAAVAPGAAPHEAAAPGEIGEIGEIGEVEVEATAEATAPAEGRAVDEAGDEEEEGEEGVEVDDEGGDAEAAALRRQVALAYRRLRALRRCASETLRAAKALHPLAAAAQPGLAQPACFTRPLAPLPALDELRAP